MSNGGDAGLHGEVLEVYQSHSASLLRYARILTGLQDASIAQDAVQDAFFAYFLHRRAGNPIDNPRRWLQQRLKENLDRATARAPRGEIVQATSGIAVDGSSDILFDVQRRLPHLLSPRELQAMRLRSQGFRYTEIADALSVTVGTVGTMIARAVRKLQAEFAPKQAE